MHLAPTTAAGLCLALSRVVVVAAVTLVASGPVSTLTYKNFTIDTSAIASASDRDAVLDAVRGQLDLVAAVKVDADKHRFLESIPLVMVASTGSARYGAGHVVVPMHSTPPYDKDHPILLHELLHAYHALRIPGGFANAEIERLYRQASASGQFPSGSYMLGDVQEYFAMMASVFLNGSAMRDPFTRDAIKTKQPEMYQWLVKEFGDLR